MVYKYSSLVLYFLRLFLHLFLRLYPPQVKSNFNRKAHFVAMARRNLLLYLILLLSTHLAFAQTSTQTLPPTITTVRFTGTSTFMFPTAPATETVFAQTMTFASKVTGGIQASEISVGAGYTISNFSANQYAACWFPVSVSALCCAGRLQ